MATSPDRSLPGEARRDLAADRPLTVPLLIRGSFDNGLLATLVVIAGLLFMGGLFGLVRDRSLIVTLTCWSTAAVVGVPALVLGLWLRLQRQWLEVTLTGFVLSQRDQRRVYSDDQVIGIAQTSHTGGEPAVLKRRVVLEIATNATLRVPSERIDCRYPVVPPNVDPVAAFFERLIVGLAKRTDEGLSSGATLRGDGWRLDASGLHVRRGTSRQHLSLDDIDWVGFYDGHLCLWTGEERPALRLPLTGRNVGPLGHVLWRRIQQRPGHDQPLRGSRLGRLLLERRSWGFFLGLGLLVCALVGMALFVVLGWMSPRGEQGFFMMVAVACACFAGVGGIVAACGRFGWLRFYEHGVVQSGLGGKRQLMYPEIGEVIWKKDQVLILKPRLSGPVIRFRTVAGKLDADLAGMRDHACRCLAMRWGELVPAGPLTWTPRLRFLPGGLEYRPMGLLMLGDPVSVPYEYTSYRIEGEHFLLFVSDQKRPACKERLDVPNFFVGLVLLNWIYASLQQHQLAVPDLGEAAPRPTMRGPSTGDERVMRDTEERRVKSD